MAIRFKAEHADWGMLLVEIQSLADARQLRRFLVDRGLQPIITSDTTRGRTIMLYGLSREEFDLAIAGADVELT